MCAFLIKHNTMQARLAAPLP